MFSFSFGWFFSSYPFQDQEKDRLLSVRKKQPVGPVKMEFIKFKKDKKKKKENVCVTFGRKIYNPSEKTDLQLLPTYLVNQEWNTQYLMANERMDGTKTR